ncbi:MAG: sodium:solute symporter family protein [Pseudomonadales bacterium]|nr:sodium:solute symporter family protein [Pseudomonadales bacterium]
MDQQTTVLIGVGVYLALMLIVGIFAAGRTHDATDFMVAGRNLNLPMSTATIMATWIGGGSILGAAGAAHQDGFLGVIADPFGTTLGLVIIGLFVVRIIRRLKLMTNIQFFEMRYGKLAGFIASVGYSMSNVGWAGALMVAFGVMLESLTGFPLETGIIAGAAIMLVYTTAGGMWAVAMTDFVQIFIIIIGLFILLIVVLINFGGVSAIWADIPEGNFRMIPTEQTGLAWLDYLRAWLIISLADAGSQSLMQRGLAARNERTAQNAFYFAAIGYITLGMIPVILGIIAAVYLPVMDDPESVIIVLAQENLHPILLAIFVGAILSAVMSSADSSLLAASSIITTNMLPYLGFKLSPKGHLRALRIAIPVLGIMAAFIALEVQAVYALVLDANVMVLAALAVPFVLGIWWKKANPYGGLAGMFAGLATWLFVINVYEDLPSDLIGCIACLVTMLIVTPLTQKLSPPRRLVDIDGNEVPLSNRLGTLKIFR